MKRILVTGGAGFIGSNFIRHVLKSRRGVTVLNLDLLTYAGNLENTADAAAKFGKRYSFVKADVADCNAVERIFRKFRPDAVANFAAETHVDRSIMDCAEFIRTNVIGTHTLLEAVRTRPGIRFMQISTDEVYGSLGPKGAFRETDPLCPRNPYSASKAAADLLVLSYVNTHKIDALITRSSNNYGSFQFPEKFIPVIIMNTLAGRSIPVYGDGLQVRDWLHVEDNCAGILAALEKGKTGGVYNIGGGNEIANVNLVKMILEILGRSEELIKFVPDRPGHDRRYALDISRAKKELGWKPAIPFKSGLAGTVAWYVSNRKWLDGVLTGEYMKYYRRNYTRRK